MTTILPKPSLLCSICKNPVAVETSKADEYGHAIHEDCYILKLQLFQSSQSSRKPSTQC